MRIRRQQPWLGSHLTSHPSATSDKAKISLGAVVLSLLLSWAVSNGLPFCPPTAKCSAILNVTHRSSLEKILIKKLSWVFLIALLSCILYSWSAFQQTVCYQARQVVVLEKKNGCWKMICDKAKVTRFCICRAAKVHTADGALRLRRKVEIRSSQVPRASMFVVTPTAFILKSLIRRIDRRRVSLESVNPFSLSIF